MKRTGKGIAGGEKGSAKYSNARVHSKWCLGSVRGYHSPLYFKSFYACIVFYHTYISNHFFDVYVSPCKMRGISIVILLSGRTNRFIKLTDLITTYQTRNIYYDDVKRE